MEPGLRLVPDVRLRLSDVWYSQNRGILLANREAPVCSAFEQRIRPKRASSRVRLRGLASAEQGVRRQDPVVCDNENAVCGVMIWSAPCHGINLPAVGAQTADEPKGNAGLLQTEPRSGQGDTAPACGSHSPFADQIVRWLSRRAHVRPVSDCSHALGTVR
jgi:hypothetical protein